MPRDQFSTKGELYLWQFHLEKLGVWSYWAQSPWCWLSTASRCCKCSVKCIYTTSGCSIASAGPAPVSAEPSTGRRRMHRYPMVSTPTRQQNSFLVQGGKGTVRGMEKVRLSRGRKEWPWEEVGTGDSTSCHIPNYLCWAWKPDTGFSSLCLQVETRVGPLWGQWFSSGEWGRHSLLLRRPWLLPWLPWEAVVAILGALPIGKHSSLGSGCPGLYIPPHLYPYKTVTETSIGGCWPCASFFFLSHYHLLPSFCLQKLSSTDK